MSLENDPLRRLREEEEIPEKQRLAFEEKGHVMFRGLVRPDEMAYIEPYILDLVERESYEDNIRMKNFRKDGRKEVRLVENMRHKSEVMHRFSTARKFAKMAADLMGVESVRVLADHTMFKEPGDRNTAWNQDCNYVAINTDRIISMWLHLTDLRDGEGALSFISGSHRLNDRTKGDLRHLNTAIRENMPIENYGGVSAGDATFHAGWTFHSAPDNLTNETRKIIRIMYVDGNARIMNEEEMGHKYAAGIFTKYFIGMNYGDRLEDPVYPLVYSKKRKIC
ncbi:phytanoyl-CoA dioxygenase family protein [Paenibacillus chitinolyticus]|uniref:phytanoyl-CoA dioxygenase family protein n=1 Tax=Paenibacillus chitinolyticus TaxID=79263 RepID=UPI0038687C98